MKSLASWWLIDGEFRFGYAFSVKAMLALIGALVGMLVSSCDQQKNEIKKADLSVLTADQLVELLIPKLPNPNPNYDGMQPAGWSPPPELLADNARVWHAREELDRRGTVVIDRMIESINDDRYAGFLMHEFNYDVYPYTIAEHCVEHIESIINPWHFGPHVMGWDEPSFLSQFVVGDRKVGDRPWFLHNFSIPKLREWWKARQQWSLQRLHLEVLGWRESDAIKRQLPLDYLEKVRAEIKRVAAL